MKATLTFLGDDWLREAAEVVEQMPRLERNPGSAVVTYRHTDDDAGLVVHTQVWDDGRMVSWTAGEAVEPSGPDAIIECELWAAYLWLFGRVPVGATLHVREPSGTVWTLPPTPSDLQATVSSIEIGGADLTAVVAVPDHPFAERRVTYRFVNGTILLEDVASPTDAAVRDALELTVPFNGGCSFLLGGTPFSEFARESTVDGDLHLLASLTGLIAPPGVDIDHSATHRAVSCATAAMAATGALRTHISHLEERTEVP